MSVKRLEEGPESKVKFKLSNHRKAVENIVQSGLVDEHASLLLSTIDKCWPSTSSTGYELADLATVALRALAENNSDRTNEIIKNLLIADNQFHLNPAIKSLDFMKERLVAAKMGRREDGFALDMIAAGAKHVSFSIRSHAYDIAEELASRDVDYKVMKQILIDGFSFELLSNSKHSVQSAIGVAARCAKLSMQPDQILKVLSNSNSEIAEIVKKEFLKQSA